MTLNEKMLKNGEQAMLELRALYAQHGYAQYKMSKFEEYDLYVRNKDFLVGDGVITFNDTDGKLLALKPDVTLSIIKNTKDAPGVTQKVYYNENVYRISRSTHTFKEILQTGLECVGDIDIYSLAEVVLLASESLAAVSDSYVLDLSHMGIVSSFVNAVPASDGEKGEIIRCIGEKNVHGVRAILSSCGVGDQAMQALETLISAYGEPESVFEKLRPLCKGGEAESALCELEAIVAALSSVGSTKNINIDFSVVNDMNYYNGIVFRGFVDGIPEGILSGGQYDRLMRKMGRRSGAVGFAVYLDLLERLDVRDKTYDADIFLLYETGCDAGMVLSAVRELGKDGARVLAGKCVPENLRFQSLYCVKDGEVLKIESHD